MKRGVDRPFCDRRQPRWCGYVKAAVAAAPTLMAGQVKTAPATAPTAWSGRKDATASSMTARPAPSLARDALLFRPGC